MKIGLYGVSRCGKDFLINHVLKTVRELSHLRGSATLQKLAQENYRTDFDTLSDCDKDIIRVALTEEVYKEERKVGNIVVDGHYSFPSESGGYSSVFTQADHLLYDVFIYMNTEPAQIIKNQNQINPSRNVVKYTVSKIAAWQKYEIEEMRELCKALGKELLVINGDFECAVSFFAELIRTPEKYMPRSIAKRLIFSNRVALEYVDTVALMDCDKTLAINDTTMTFCDEAGIDRHIIRDNYYGEYYSTYQFYRANRFFDEVLPDEKYYDACTIAARTAQINQALLADIQSGVGNYITFAITSGILDIWERIQKKQKFPEIIVGKGRSNGGGEYVSTLVKQVIVEELQALGKTVIAIGDSPIDIGMLEVADKGYIVAMQKHSSGVVKYLSKTPNTRIRQLSYSSCKYNDIIEESSIWQ